MEYEYEVNLKQLCEYCKKYKNYNLLDFCDICNIFFCVECQVSCVICKDLLSCKTCFFNNDICNICDDSICSFCILHCTNCNKDSCYNCNFIKGCIICHKDVCNICSVNCSLCPNTICLICNKYNDYNDVCNNCNKNFCITKLYTCICNKTRSCNTCFPICNICNATIILNTENIITKTFPTEIILNIFSFI